MMQDPRELERAQNFLFSSEEEMKKARLTPTEQARLLRLRSTYSYWLANPRLAERDVAQFIRRTYNVGQSSAYNDLRLLKMLLGSLNSATTDFYRWQFIQRCDEGFRMARANQDASAYARVLAAYLKGTQLDKEKAQTIDYSIIVPQNMEFTGDPRESGLPYDPNAKAKAQEYLARWRKEMTEAPAVEFEELRRDVTEKPAPLHAEIHPKD